MGRTRLDAEENNGLELVLLQELDHGRYRHGERSLLVRSEEETFQRRGVELRHGGPQRCCADGREAWSTWSSIRTQGRPLTTRVLLGDDDGQIKDLSGICSTRRSLSAAAQRRRHRGDADFGKLEHLGARGDDMVETMDECSWFMMSMEGRHHVS